MKGRHDFRAFGPAPIEGGHTVRSVHLLTWARDGGYLQMDIVADAFLQHMVRRVVAASLEVAAGRVEVAETARLIDAPVERWEGPLAKPGGLFLMRVGYQPWAGPGSIEGPEEGGNKDNERPEDLLP